MLTVSLMALPIFPLQAKLKQSLNQVFEKVVVINLARRADRLHNITGQLDAHGITFERFDAVDARELGVSGVVACAMSHRAVVEKYKDCQNLFIFEDDAVLDSAFETAFDAVMANIPDNWQMLYLGCFVQQSETINKKVSRLIGGITTHGYGFKNEIFDKLIAVSYRNEPIDLAYMSLHPSLNAYVAKPTLVNQLPGYSDIEESVKDYTVILQ
jgi:GR25 family glycosyltransferase involved in LPS biosynthesis